MCKLLKIGSVRLDVGCENNAKAEGVTNASFQQGDAVNIDFADETFDAVTSNYVYHNIPVKDRQAILLETLRSYNSAHCQYTYSSIILCANCNAASVA